jgi:hypothetical protein
VTLIEICAVAGAVGGVVSPTAVVVGLMVQARSTERVRIAAEAKRQTALEKADASVLAMVEGQTAALRDLTAQMARSNDEREKHEVECSGRWGAADAKMEVLVERGRDVVGLAEKVGAFGADQAHNKALLERGQGRFDEAFRALGNLTEGIGALQKGMTAIEDRLSTGRRTKP